MLLNNFSDDNVIMNCIELSCMLGMNFTLSMSQSSPETMAVTFTLTPPTTATTNFEPVRITKVQLVGPDFGEGKLL